MTQYQARHRLVRPTNYCRGCGNELHHLGALFCEKDDCQAIRASWKHVRHNYKQNKWRQAHLDWDRENNRLSYQRHKEKRNAQHKQRYWANPAVRQYYNDYSTRYNATKRLKKLSAIPLNSETVFKEPVS